MKVFKFGGASVKDADAVKNLAEILTNFKGEKIAIVISAMGKTTNALEVVAKAHWDRDDSVRQHLDDLKTFHDKIIVELFGETPHEISNEVNNALVEIEWAIEDEPTGTYDFEYDQIVSMGEVLSTKIVTAYLNHVGMECTWIDARDMIKTDNTYREAKIDWELTEKAVQKGIARGHKNTDICITQGFIGVTSENFTTTLGREGSDFSAAILAYSLGAQSMTIWKDVPGMLNADPKWFDETLKLNHISYKEAIELAYYGATVIHPKTIKPLQNKSITLYVKSFLNIEEEGTKIDYNTGSDSLIPSFIFKMDQVLISVSPRDFSFIAEDNLAEIFGLFAESAVRINLMQNSAINFSATVDNDPRKIPALLEALAAKYETRINEDLELVTIRHYDQATVDRVTVGKEMLVEQKSRATARMVMKDLGWFEGKN